MKIQYVDGTGAGYVRTPFGEIIVRGIRVRWSYVCGSVIAEDDMFSKKVTDRIVIVRQKNKWITMFILFHEILHYITIKVFGRDSKIHDWIDKYI